MAGIIAYGLFVIITTPAVWWLRMLPVPAAVQFGQVSGSLWQGQIRQLQIQQVPFSDLRWQLNPWSLLMLRADITVTAGAIHQENQPYLSAHIQLKPTEIRVTNGLLKLPVATLLPLLQLPVPVQATGELVLEINQLQVRDQECASLIGNASWLDAKLQPPVGSWLDLQHFHANLSCENQQPVLITDPANILALDVRATVNAAGKLQVSGTLRPAAELPAEVHQAMQFVGAPDAEGRYRLNF